MKISVQTGGIEEHIGVDACYQLVREAGFDAVDVNLDHLLTPSQIKSGERAEAFEGTDEEILKHFMPWKAAAEKYGIDNYQAHAPFPGYVVDPTGEYNAYLLHVLEKTIMGCAYIGCRYLIIHPFFLDYANQVDDQTEWETNISRYAALIPAAKRYGVTICLENMFKHIVRVVIYVYTYGMPVCGYAQRDGRREGVCLLSGYGTFAFDRAGCADGDDQAWRQNCCVPCA